MRSIYNALADLYINQGYYQEYSVDISVVVLIVVFVLVVGLYFLLSSSSKSLLKNWPANRYRPEILPIAGLIYKFPGLSAFESTNLNFSNYLVTQGSEGMKFSLQPSTFLNSVLGLLITGLNDAIEELRSAIAELRADFATVFGEAVSTLDGVGGSMGAQQHRVGSIMSKMSAVLRVFLYIGMSVVILVLTFFKMVLKAFIIVSILPLLVTIGMAYACVAAATPFVWPVALSCLAAALLGIALAVLAIVIAVELYELIDDFADASGNAAMTENMPKVPKAPRKK